MNFNDKIDLFMKENNIKYLKQLALKSDIQYTTLRDFYNKISTDNSRLSIIRNLSEYMQCSLDYLTFDNAKVIYIKSDVIKILVLKIIKQVNPLKLKKTFLNI